MPSTDPQSTAARTAASVDNPPTHPFQHSTSLIEIIPEGIDVEEESRLYDELCEVSAIAVHNMICCLIALLQSPVLDITSDMEYTPTLPRPRTQRSKSRSRPSSVFSHDTDVTSIWLADNSHNAGSHQGFARDVQIVGWTSVGDKLGGAYIVYDCAIFTKEGAVVHTHKRYSAFAQLHAQLRTTLPRQLQTLVPPLPPKSPLSKFRATFLDRRRRALQHWLASILLHPDIGGCEMVRAWVME